MTETENWCADMGGLNGFSARETFSDLIKYFDFMHRVWELNCKVISSIKGLTRKINIQNPEDDDEFLLEFTTWQLAGKALKTHLAIENLLEAGYLEDAFSLMRSILEIVINMEYIRQETGRAKLFQEYSYIARWRLLQAKLKHYGKNISAGEHEKKITGLKAKYETLIGNYPKPTSWCKHTIKQMAEEVELDSSYDLLYSLLSWYVHGNCMAADRLINGNEMGLTLTIAPAGNKKGDYLEAVFLTCFFSLMLIKVFESVFKTGFEDEIEARYNEYLEIFKQEREQED